ncbi:hypothetical protein KEM48_000799 [Puccinia striiformis f. sp. tritici PST-130]|nr:hypothetical protein KEM48_000799 [Puccinia striiformis f. sp. tritici PST-130]
MIKPPAGSSSTPLLNHGCRSSLDHSYRHGTRWSANWTRFHSFVQVQKASVDTEHRPLRLFSLPLDKGPSGSVSQERVLSTLRIHQAWEGLPGEPPSQVERIDQEE